jgi:hypothetical protein
MKYKYQHNEDGTKSLKIYIENNLIVMNLSEEVAGHSDLIQYLNDENNLEKYVVYLALNPDRAFNLSEILAL